MNKLSKIFIVFIDIFLIILLLIDAEDKLASMLTGNYFAFALFIGFFGYLLWLNAVLIFLSILLKKSEIRWQRALGRISFIVAVLDLLINAIAFIWNFIR